MNQAPFRCSTCRQAPGLPRKHQTRLVILARDIHSSLLRKPVNYEQKRFYNIGPWNKWKKMRLPIRITIDRLQLTGQNLQLMLKCKLGVYPSEVTIHNPLYQKASSRQHSIHYTDEHSSLLRKNVTFTLLKDKLQLRRQNLGRVFNFRSGCMHAMHLCCCESGRPNLKLKTQPKQLLGSLPLASVLPGVTLLNKLTRTRNY